MPNLYPATVPLTASASFNGICNRQIPPPTALATSSNRLSNRFWGTSEAPSFLMHPCPKPSAPLAHSLPQSISGDLLKSFRSFARQGIPTFLSEKVGITSRDSLDDLQAFQMPPEKHRSKPLFRFLRRDKNPLFTGDGPGLQGLQGLQGQQTNQSDSLQKCMTNDSFFSNHVGGVVRGYLSSLLGKTHPFCCVLFADIVGVRVRAPVGACPARVSGEALLKLCSVLLPVGLASWCPHNCILCVFSWKQVVGFPQGVKLQVFSKSRVWEMTFRSTNSLWGRLASVPGLCLEFSPWDGGERDGWVGMRAKKSLCT